MKIVVIGSGISGLSSAYFLSLEHEVILLEKENRLGGHSHTHNLNLGGKKTNVDTGFMVFNPAMYPNFVELMSRLGIETTQTSMTFGVNIPGEVRYRGNFPKGFFADKKNIYNFRFWRFLFEIFRFQRKAKQYLKNSFRQNKSLGEFLQENKLSDDLRDWFLYPMLSAVWSMKDVEKVANFPALQTFVFLNNHRLLDLKQPKWRTIKSGSIKYVEALEKELKNHKVKIVTGAKIKSVKRTPKSVKIRYGSKEITADYVVMAVHANTAMELLDVMNEQERRALSKFTYTTNTTYLHKDKSVVSENKNLLSAWNYSLVGNKAIFSYCMNILQHIPDQHPVFVTLNPEVEIAKKDIYAKMVYEHPQYSLESIKGQQMIDKLQGKNRTYFAGAHLGFGFHEDGLVSGMNIAKKIGIKMPW